MIDPNLLIILVLLAISELLAFIPRVKANSVLQLVVNTVKFIFSEPPKKEEDQPKKWYR